MSHETWKLYLVIVLLGATGILLFGLLNDGAAPSPWAASPPFAQRVAECRQQNPEWDQITCERILRGQVWIGMTSEMLWASIGEPYRISIPYADDPDHQEWTYHTVRYGQEVFRLREDRLVGVVSIEGCAACDIVPARPVGR